MATQRKGGNINILINELRSSLKAFQCDDEALNKFCISVLTEMSKFYPNNNLLEVEPKQRLKRGNSSFSSIYSEAAEIIRKNSFREECMREAIRQHIATLVDVLPFKESEIPDSIIEEGIATTKESEILRKLRTTDDQVSGLVSLVITKDSTAMEKFLTIVAVHNTEVVDKIQHVFDAMMEIPIGAVLPCVVCDMKEKCDIKSVYNHFFARGQITAGLHRRIVQSELPVGSQNVLWNDMLNELDNTTDCSVIYVLVEAMENVGCCNKNLIQMLKRLLRKNKPLQCSCNTRVNSIPRSNTFPSSKNSNLSQVHATELQHEPIAVSLETVPKTYVLSEEHVDLNEDDNMSTLNATLKRTCSYDAIFSSLGFDCDINARTSNNKAVEASKELSDPRTMYKRSKPNNILCDNTSTTNKRHTGNIMIIHDTGRPVESDETFVKLADSNSLEENKKFIRKNYDLKKLRQKSENEYNY